MKIKKTWFLVVITMWPAFVFAQDNHMDGGRTNDGYMGNYGHMMDFWHGGIFMWLFFLIIVGALVYLIYKASQSQSPHVTSHEEPFNILKRRYAAGEITKEQFDQMKKEL